MESAITAIQRHPLTRDQDAGLAGGAEAGFQGPAPSSRRRRTSEVYICSDRAIGAHGKAAPARSFHAIGDGDISRLAPATSCNCATTGAGDRGQVLLVAQQVVQTGGKVEPLFQRHAPAPFFPRGPRSRPPRLATPITSVPRPGVLLPRTGPCRAGAHRPRQPSIRNWPTALSGRQSRMLGDLGAQLVGRVARGNRR